MPEDWRSSYTSAIDLVQQKLIDKATNATEDAEKAYKAFEKDKNEDNLKKAKDALNEAKKLVENLSTSVNEDAKNWANNVLKVKLDVINLEDVKLYGLKITGATFDKAGVKVNFDALEQSLDDVTLIVLDNNGKEVKVKSIATIKKGATEAKFAFNNYLSNRPTGVWTINGEKFNLTEVNFVEDVKEAGTTEALKVVLAKKEYKGLVTYNEERADKYLKELQKAKLEKVKDVQDIIDKVNAELDKGEGKTEYINLIKEVSVNGTQEQFNNVLNQGVEEEYIEKVNQDYMKQYKDKIKYKVENNWIGTLENIQKCINEINTQNLTTAKDALKEALQGDNKEAILKALQNTDLGLDNVKAENIDAYYMDKNNIKDKFGNNEELKEINNYIKILNDKVQVVNATNLKDMLVALKSFAESNKIAEFNNLSSQNKQDTAEQLLRVTCVNGKLTFTDVNESLVKLEVIAQANKVKENLNDLQKALQALKDIRTKSVDDVTLPLRNALKAITTNEISVELADKFYEASVNNKGKLTPYKDYTQVRTVLNGLK